MATDDDDILTGAVPGPDVEPTAAERAQAKTFADLVDKALVGRTPPAMSADDRALLEVATVIRAAHGAIELDASRQRAIVEAALQGAVGGPATTMPGVTSIAAARGRRWVPWTVAGVSTLVAAAAVLVLWLRTTPAPAQPDVAVEVPARWTSRPVDPLIGPIPRERAGDASARIDYIFADRLDGFRERRLSGPRGGRR